MQQLGPGQKKGINYLLSSWLAVFNHYKTFEAKSESIISPTQESNQGRLEEEILNQLVIVQKGLKPVIHLGCGLPITLLVTSLDPPEAVGRLQSDSGTR